MNNAVTIPSPRSSIQSTRTLLARGARSGSGTLPVGRAVPRSRTSLALTVTLPSHAVRAPRDEPRMNCPIVGVGQWSGARGVEIRSACTGRRARAVWQWPEAAEQLQLEAQKISSPKLPLCV